METIVVGVDVSKNKLDVCQLGEQVKVFANEEKGIGSLITQMKTTNPSFVVFEATGGYEYQLSKALHKANIRYSIVNPARIRNFAKAFGKVAKTDKIDAKVIKHYGEVMQPKQTIPATQAENELNLLANRRVQLMQIITAERNRKREFLPSQVKESISRSIKALKAEIEILDKAIDSAVSADKTISAKVDIVQTVVGVGRITAFSLISSVPELGTISKQKIAALVGVAPFNCDSGIHRGKMTTSGGRANARTALYMAALVAARHNKVYKPYYQRLIAKGKPKKVALTALMRKILISLNAMIRDNKPWDDTLHKI